MQFRNRIKNVVLLTCLCMLYAWFVFTFGFGIPCIFHLVTGLLCPGCGITHMYLNMLNMDFRGAFYSHPFLFLSQPAIYYFVLKLAVFYLKGREMVFSKYENVVLYGLTVGLFIFAIARNILKFLQ